MAQPEFPVRLRMPPSDVTGELGLWLRELWIAINGTPHLSWFSATSPNSNLTGYVGDIGVNLASGSTVSRIWMMGGNPTSNITNLGWVFLATGGT